MSGSRRMLPFVTACSMLMGVATAETHIEQTSSDLAERSTIPGVTAPGCFDAEDDDSDEAPLDVRRGNHGMHGDAVGRMTIHVFCDSGPLPGAMVTISHSRGLATTTSVLTDANGRTEFPVLWAGPGYALEVRFPGFSERSLRDLSVEPGGTHSVAVELVEQRLPDYLLLPWFPSVDRTRTAPETIFRDSFITKSPEPLQFYRRLLVLAPPSDPEPPRVAEPFNPPGRDFEAIVGYGPGEPQGCVETTGPLAPGYTPAPDSNGDERQDPAAPSETGDDR